jgi:ribosomal protein S18 acetylase RimI-like enzyme
VPRAIDWESLDGDANRTAMTARIEAAEMDGFLAYAADEVVGWLNAQPRARLPHCIARMKIPVPRAVARPESSAVIVCFVIAPTWRRRGVARALLAGALASFASRGIHVVDAFPFKSDDSSAATDHYHGPMSLYREAGFDVVAEHKNLTVMRKRFDRPH